MGHHSSDGFCVGQLKNRVLRASRLERTDLLEVFALEKKVRATADPRIERFTGKHRGTMDKSINASVGSPHVGKRRNCRGSPRFRSKDGTHLGQCHKWKRVSGVG